jgi:hypothetical protein
VLSYVKTNYIDGTLWDLLTELCFTELTPVASVDLSSVFGTLIFFNEISEHIVNLLHNEITNTVILAGGILPDGGLPYLWAFIRYK